MSLCIFLPFSECHLMKASILAYTQTVHLFTFSTYSLSVPVTWEFRSNVAFQSCYRSSADRDLSLCQHPAQYKLSHSRWQGSPHLSIHHNQDAQWHHWVFVCLSVKGRRWDRNQLCATQAQHSVSSQELDMEAMTASWVKPLQRVCKSHHPVLFTWALQRWHCVY